MPCEWTDCGLLFDVLRPGWWTLNCVVVTSQKQPSMSPTWPGVQRSRVPQCAGRRRVQYTAMRAADTTSSEVPPQARHPTSIFRTRVPQRAAAAPRTTRAVKARVAMGRTARWRGKSAPTRSERRQLDSEAMSSSRGSSYCLLKWLPSVRRLIGRPGPSGHSSEGLLG